LKVYCPISEFSATDANVHAIAYDRSIGKLWTAQILALIVVPCEETDCAIPKALSDLDIYIRINSSHSILLSFLVCILKATRLKSMKDVENYLNVALAFR
jgi:hypothetical protein